MFFRGEGGGGGGRDRQKWIQPEKPVTNLRVSQSLTVLSYDPEISSNSLLRDHATEETHPWCDVKVVLMTVPSERHRKND